MTTSRTPIAIIRDHVEAWRRDNDWSRETVAQTIVEAHERLGLNRLTGIKFEPPTSDPFERMRVNADKIFRWLDDHTKDRNLLTVNFLWSILAAMPVDRRLALADALLAPVGLVAGEEDIGVDMAEGQDQTVVAIVHFREVAETTAAASVGISKMVDGIDPGEPEAAKAKIARARAALKRAGAFCARVLHLQRKKAA
ncbi:MAG: hypothetical protein Q7U97_13270 [Rhodocyclaceae bacterium]|nr:hypothetical protein [Rhodocyclaceae bacterium]